MCFVTVHLLQYLLVLMARAALTALSFWFRKIQLDRLQTAAGDFRRLAGGGSFWGG